MSKLAAIDIGTNTLLMTVAELESDNQTITTLNDYHSIARLGEGVDKTKNINANALERASAILRNYREICDKEQIENILVCGTSAMRDAENSQEIVDKFSEIIKSDVEIIAGKTEARLSYIGAIDDNNSAVVVDIGGGSSEICFGEGGELIDSISLDFGAVRIKERYFQTLPPSESSIISAKNNIDEILNSFSPKTQNGQLYAVAGTATSLASIDLMLKQYSAIDVHNHIIDVEKVAGYSKMLLAKTFDELLQIPGMHPQRADLMPAGALILTKIMERLSKNNVRVSIRGLRYGILKELAHRKFGATHSAISLDNIL